MGACACKMDGRAGSTASTPVEVTGQGSTCKGKETGKTLEILLKMKQPVKSGMNNHKKHPDHFLVCLFLEQTISLHCCKSITGGS